MFRSKKIINKNDTSKDTNSTLQSTQFNVTKMDKEKWFKTHKNNFYEEQNVEKVNYYQEVKNYFK